jgi:uncharacterized protein
MSNISPLDDYRPHPKWFSNAPSGIHGVGHCMRVLVWADYCAACLELDGIPVDRVVVRWAAACHDCRRHDDGLDPDHGQRAAAWFGKQGAQLDPTLTRAQVQAVQHAVTWHVPADHLCSRWTPELRCLKDADGLDRVRLGDFDSRYLRLPYLHGREPDAEALLTASFEAEDPWLAIVPLAVARGIAAVGISGTSTPNL